LDDACTAHVFHATTRRDRFDRAKVGYPASESRSAAPRRTSIGNRLLSGAAALAVVALVSVGHADPVPRSDPDTCPTAFDCGALSARLAAVDHDYPAALRASARACQMDAMFCNDHATLLVDAGKARGGDPDKGLEMLEASCAKPDTFACSKLSRVYDDPPAASGFRRRPADAERILSSECDGGESVSCGMLAGFYERGCAYHTKNCPPGVAPDKAKAKSTLEKACRTNDEHAAGYCAELGDKLVTGELGPKDRPRGRALLEAACAKGYWCERAVDLALADGDLAAAKRTASAGCQYRPFVDDCGLIEKLEPKDRAWARAEYSKLCASARIPSTKQWACAREARSSRR